MWVAAAAAFYGTWDVVGMRPEAQISRSLLLLFFRKEVLPYFIRIT
jgi:hypothetical protein